MKRVIVAVMSVGLFLIYFSTFQVNEGEEVVVKRGGNPVREYHDAGIHYKIPFVETTVYVDKRLQLADFVPQNMPTSDSKNFTADMFALWRVENARLYVQTLGGRNDVAESRLSRVVFSQAGSRLAQNPLNETLTTERDLLMKEAADASNLEAGQFGAMVALIRLNKVDLPESSKESTYARMNANLNKIRSELLSSGDATAAARIAEANRTATETLSGAHLKAKQLEAEGITEAGKIRKEAYASNQEVYVWYRDWLLKSRVWQASRPDTIYQNGSENYNRFQ